MNIFKILAMGDGVLKEPNVSSFLAYLLNPKLNEDKEFCKKLLQVLYNAIKEDGDDFDVNNYGDHEIDVELEYQLHQEEKRNDGDIIITFSKGENIEKFLCIENKITDSSHRKNQIEELLNGLKIQFVLDNNMGSNYLIYLTPSIRDINIRERNISIKEISWNKENGGKSMKNVIQMSLSYCKNETLRKIIEQFIEFIDTNFRSLEEFPTIENSGYVTEDVYDKFVVSRSIRSKLDQTQNRIKNFLEQNKIDYSVKRTANSSNKRCIFAIEGGIRRSEYHFRLDIKRFNFEILFKLSYATYNNFNNEELVSNWKLKRAFHYKGNKVLQFITIRADTNNVQLDSLLNLIFKYFKLEYQNNATLH